MEAKTLEILTGIIFVVTYLLIIKFYKKKTRVIWGGVIAMLLFGSITISGGLESINWNVIGIYIGMLFLAEALIVSKIPDAIAVKVVNWASHASVVMLLLCFITSLLSIVLENVACVLLVAPIVFSISKKLHITPIPTLIGCAISSNLQGVATLIGDPPSMLLAGHANLTFNDFFIFQDKLSLFFAVQIGMLASLLVLYLFFKKYDKKVGDVQPVKVRSYFPSTCLILMIIALAWFSFIDSGIHFMMGAICMFFGTLCLGWMLWFKKKNKNSVWHAIQSMDWNTALFIVAVFIMVESLINVGIIRDIAIGIYNITGSNLLVTYITIIFISMVISAFVDNIPYIVAMLPVITIISTQMNASPYVLYFGLLIGASVGGNITPIGASANIVSVGLLRNRNHDTTFWDFVKIGLPFTIVATLVSSVFIWFMFGV